MSVQDNNQKQLTELMDHLFRNEYGKMVSFLSASFGFDFIDSAEDIAQDTLLEAYKSWSYKGVPENPHAWLFKVAKNKALNLVKREKVKSRVYETVSAEDHLKQQEAGIQEHVIEDSMLRMIFACCKPEIPSDSQIALILTILCGFSRKEAAHSLLVDEETLKKKLYRAKKKLRELHTELVIPAGKDLRAGLKTVCTSLYLFFNEGYNSPHSDELIRKDLCLEAMRLCQLLVQHFKGETQVPALFSLMCFHAARFDSRLDEKGAIVLFKDQDRKLWSKELIQAGLYYLSEAARDPELTTYHLEASIAARHCQTESYEQTDWEAIAALYRKLYELKPSPVIRLNLAIIAGKTEGPESGIRQIEELLKTEKKLKNYYLLYATLGQLYLETNQKEAALLNFEKARSLTSSDKEQKLLDDKIRSMGK